MIGAVFITSDYCNRGDGIGEGVIRAVLERSIKMMLADDRYWRSALDEMYFSLAPRRETSTLRCTRIKAFATLIMISIFYGITPDPVSPFLLASILQGSHAIEDQSFIHEVAPATAMSFSDWPVDDSPVLPSQHNHMLLANIDMQVSNV
jgi:hypothetical protein